jgi:hypothetical protein
MKPVHILVNDSYHTRRIADSIRKHFGDKVLCFEEQQLPEGEVAKMDIFILSGRDVLESSQGFVAEYKTNWGSENCKVIAVSTLDDYLDEIDRRPELSVDHTIPKGDLVNDLVFADKGRKGGAKKILEETVALFI